MVENLVTYSLALASTVRFLTVIGPLLPDLYCMNKIRHFDDLAIALLVPLIVPAVRGGEEDIRYTVQNIHSKFKYYLTERERN